MFLINALTLELEFFDDENKVPGGYAILSHVWEKDANGKSIEISHKNITDPMLRKFTQSSKSWHKINMSCAQAQREQPPLQYVWVDTCCIDKTSSAELQEAINSMCRWYSSAAVCYAYLYDVISENLDDRITQFCKSKWFTRGWTLQELLAPDNVIFYDVNWRPIGSRQSLLEHIHTATKIPEIFIDGFLFYNAKPCAAEIMFWASERETTRIEDRAYSLLGLFDVQMPLLYGEGNKALIRLQHEILISLDDQSLFAWQDEASSNGEHIIKSSGLLATTLRQFTQLRLQFLSIHLQRCKEHSIGGGGITAEFELVPLAPRVYIALLNLEIRHEYQIRKLGILVKRIDEEGRYVRVPSKIAKSFYQQPHLVYFDHTLTSRMEKRQITVVKALKRDEAQLLERADFCGFQCQAKNICQDFELLVQHPNYSKTDGTIFAVKPADGSTIFTYGVVGAMTPQKPNYPTCWGWTKEYPFFCFHLCHVRFGFDFDYNPVCALIMKIYDTSANQPVHHVHKSDFNDMSLSNRMLRPETSFNDGLSGYTQKIDSNLTIKAWGSRWQNFDDGYLMIKTTNASRDTGTGFRAIINMRSRSQDVLFLTLSRAKDQDPWKLGLEGIEIPRWGEGF